MRLNIMRYKVAAKKRNHHKENMPIGSAIKYKRHALHMTLEEASKDICSVSYLSKLENNVIVPSEKYVMKLKQRFCLQDDSIDWDEGVYLRLKQQLQTVLLNDGKCPKQFKSALGSQFNYQTLLLSFGVHVLSQNKEKIYDIYQRILPVISSMPDVEFALLNCLVSRVLYHESRYEESNEILAMQPDNIDDHLILYRDKWMILNAIKMENTALFHLLYPRYKATLIHLGYYKQMDELNRHTINFFSQTMRVSDFQHLLHQQKRLSRKVVQETKVRNLLENGYEEKALTYIQKHFKTLDNEWFIMKLKALDKLDKSDEVKQLITTHEHLELSRNQALLVSFLKTKHGHNKKRLLIYLRTVILGDDFLTDDVHMLKFLQCESHKLFSQYFYYKEATEVFQKFNRLISRLKMSRQYVFKELDSSFFSLK